MIIGVLSWFDESPSWLGACVASMARVCGHVVAVDGRYALYDHDMSASPVEQTEAVVEAAAGAGLALTLHRPVQPFYGNEVEKRNLTLKLAACVGEPMRDWLLVLDGDCYITDHSPMLPRDLEATDALAVNVLVDEVIDPNDPERPLDVARITAIPTYARSPVTLLYRMLPNMAYVGTHYSLGGEVDGKWTWLWGHGDAVAAEKVPSQLVIRHRNAVRPIHRRRAASEYYRVRDDLRIEVRPRWLQDWADAELPPKPA